MSILYYINRYNIIIIENKTPINDIYGFEIDFLNIEGNEFLNLNKDKIKQVFFSSNGGKYTLKYYLIKECYLNQYINLN